MCSLLSCWPSYSSLKLGQELPATFSSTNWTVLSNPWWRKRWTLTICQITTVSLKPGTMCNTRYNRNTCFQRNLTEFGFWFQYRCCGIQGYADWQQSNWHKDKPKESVPDSCCRTYSSGCGTGMAVGSVNETIYENGCLPIFINHVKVNGSLFVGVAIGLSAIQVGLQYWLIFTSLFIWIWSHLEFDFLNLLICWLISQQ